MRFGRDYLIIFFVLSVRVKGDPESPDRSARALLLLLCCNSSFVFCISK